MDNDYLDLIHLQFKKKSMSEKIKSIKDIAKSLGVSKSTVSRALNDSPLISDDTREKIQAFAKEHSFCINQTARSLSIQKTGIIAFVLPEKKKKHECNSDDPFMAELLGSLVRNLNYSGYDLLIIHANINSNDWINKYIDGKLVDAIITLSCPVIDSIFNIVNKRDMPFIQISKISEDKNSVSCDDYNGAIMAIKHLYETGKRNIAFIGGIKEDSETILRYNGYIEALKKYNLEIDTDLIDYGDYSPGSGYDAMKRILETNKKIDAVFVCSDVMACCAMDAIKENNLKIPEDVSVIGFDDTVSNLCRPELTTIHQDISLLAKECVNVLLNYIETGIISQKVLPVKLIKRDST